MNYPPSTYPPPVASQGAALQSCPDTSGLEAFTPAVVKLAREAAANYARKSLATDLHNSDRSWWPYVRKEWHTNRHASGLVVLDAQPVTKLGYQVFLKPSCGARVVAKTEIVTLGPAHQTCEACRVHLFFVNRRGRPLIYYLY